MVSFKAMSGTSNYVPQAPGRKSLVPYVALILFAPQCVWLGVTWMTSGATMGWIDGGTCLESDGAEGLAVCWQHDECRQSLIQKYVYNTYYHICTYIYIYIFP